MLFMYHSFSSWLCYFAGDHALLFDYALIAWLMRENGPTFVTHYERDDYINKIARHIFDS